MILTDFDYRRPATLPEAWELLGAAGPAAVVLAGGQSLLPALKAGTGGAADPFGSAGAAAGAEAAEAAEVTVLVDIGRISGLDGITVEDGLLRLGALVRHHDLLTSAPVRTHAPLLAHVAGEVADPQVRHRGTLGGSLAYADPAADLPTALLALDATVTLAGPDGTRDLPVADFCLGRHRTALAPGELLTGVTVPCQTGHWAYQKFHRDTLEWALVAVAAVRPGAGRDVRIALANLADTPVRAHDVERAVAAGRPAAEAALSAVGDDRPLTSDRRASDDYRRHLARVLTARALAALGL